MARNAGLTEDLVTTTATDTVAKFRDVWARERANLPMHSDVSDAVDRQLEIVPLR